MKFRITLILFVVLTIYNAFSDDTPEIGIDYYKFLGQNVPLELEFTNSSGELKSLNEIIDKPTILALVYYNCPGICSPLLDNLGEVIALTRAKIGEEYQVISISIDHSETAELAKRWQRNYHAALDKPINSGDWEFYVGDSLSIRKLSDAVGYYFKPDGQGDFIHSGGLIVLSKDGQIIRYLLGTKFNPFEIQMSVIEASKGMPTPAIGRLLEYCFSYDPAGKTYVFNVTKVAGTAVFAGAGLFLIVLVVIGRKRNLKNSKGE